MEIDSIINYFVIDSREGTKSCQNLSEPSQQSFYNSCGIDQSYGSPLIHYRSNGTCKDSVNISSTTANCVSKGKYELSVGSNIKHQVKNRINLVGRLEVYNDQTFSQLNPHMIIQTDVSLTVWGAVCNGFKTSWQWSEEERTLYITVLELLAIGYFPLPKGKQENHKLSDRKQGRLVLLSKKRGETKYEHMIKFSQEVQNYLLNHNMSITTEYLISVLNTIADRE